MRRNVEFFGFKNTRCDQTLTPNELIKNELFKFKDLIESTNTYIETHNEAVDLLWKTEQLLITLKNSLSLSVADQSAINEQIKTLETIKKLLQDRLENSKSLDVIKTKLAEIKNLKKELNLTSNVRLPTK
jgi:hypothetical protein